MKGKREPFFHLIIKEICSEMNIKIEKLSYGWILQLSKEGQVRHITDYMFDNNPQATGVIVSDKYEEIAKEISKETGRGSTAITATGMYENAERKILWCVASKGEITKIRQIANRIDKGSFMSIFNAREVYGMGFKRI